MADTANTTAPAADKAAKAKDVLNDMDSRRVLPNVTDAAAYVAKCVSDFPDFNTYPLAAPGVDVTEDGSALVFDPAIYTDEMAVMVAVLTQRGDGADPTTVKAIVISPVPTIESVIANDAARDWLRRIMEKELNHVAVRQLRKADDISDVIESMPTTLEEYIASNRESSGILQAYEELWRPIKNNMAKLSKSWKLANLSKRELRRCLESASYAGEYYPTLEESKSGSLFVLALNGLIATAKNDGLDPTIFERWLAGRDEKVIESGSDDEDEEELSLDALTAAMATAKPAATPAEGSAPANEGEGEAPATGTGTDENTENQPES